MIFKRTIMAYTHDLLMTALSVVLALYLRVGEDLFSEKYLDVLALSVPVYVVVAAVTFRLMGMYRGIWRYASVADLISIVKGVSMVIIVAMPILFFITRLEDYPRSAPVIQWFLMLSMLGGPRFLYRWLRDRRIIRYQKDHPAIHEQRTYILLVGAGDGAEIFIRSCVNNYKGDYVISAILDPKGKRGGRSMLGVPIYAYDRESFPKVLAEIGRKGPKPTKIIFTESEADDSELVRDIDRIAEKEGMSLGRLPSLTEFEAAQRENRFRIKPIAIEDLLGRPQTELDLQPIKDMVKGRRVLITGAGGTIGSELVRQIAGFSPASLMLLDNSEYNLYTIDMALQEEFPSVARQIVLCDVRDAKRVHKLFGAFKPDLVFHAAALKHVPMVELNPEEGILTNLIGSMNVADACAASAVKAMVQISTDKAVNPTNIMGATKRLAEFYCQALDLAGEKTQGATRFMTVRFGNVLGSSGSVVPLFKKQLEKGGPLTVTHPEIKRYFMTVTEAVRLVLQASAHGVNNQAQRGQIFVLDMGTPMKIADVARKMIRLAGYEPDKDIQVSFTGLRPGEKLYEELFDQSEVPVKTDLTAVMAAMPQPIEARLLKKTFSQLEKAAKDGELKEVDRLIGTLVSGYEHGKADSEQNQDANIRN